VEKLGERQEAQEHSTTMVKVMQLVRLGTVQVTVREIHAVVDGRVRLRPITAIVAKRTLHTPVPVYVEWTLGWVIKLVIRICRTSDRSHHTLTYRYSYKTYTL